MSEKYDEYIKEHKENVTMAFRWLVKNLPELFENNDFKADCEYCCEFNHDNSKYEEDEYEAYDKYFYGGNKSFDVVQNFNKAWLKHIHRNPHHWQHWVLINDDPNEGEIILDMPDEYIIEMICDWWSFSFKKGDLKEIFNWYEEHEKYMKLSDYTRRRVCAILSLIKSKLSTPPYKISIESDVNEEN